MRISTAGIHHAAVTAMLQQQTSLSKLQNQIATGKRVQTPADDPVAAVHILELNRALKEADQYTANADVASNRLALEEQALQEVGSDAGEEASVLQVRIARTVTANTYSRASRHRRSRSRKP